MKIAILGHFGANKLFNDGQTVKTRTLASALSSAGVAVYPIDTYDIKHSPFRFAWRFGASIFHCKKYVVLLSINGRKILFPLLYGLAKILNKQIYHDVIGGKFADEVVENPRLKKYICAFESNWVESHFMVEKLQAQGVKNATYVANFKLISPLPASKLPEKPNAPLRFCTFSRVVKEKGITDAIQAVAQLNQKNLLATLDVYGPVAKEYETEFEKLCAQYKNFCTYGGIIGAEKSVETLKVYDMLLFPTYWPGEGMPGTVIDALCAGVPILARRWMYCDEMIIHQKTGLVYDFDKPEKLSEWLNYAVSHAPEIHAMKSACLAAGAAYTAQTVVPQILTLLRQEE